MSDIQGDRPVRAKGETMTFGDMTSLIVAGYLAPQQSARGLIDRGLGQGVGVVMVVLGYLITAILLKLMGHGGEDVRGLGGHAWNLVLQIGYFFFISVLVFWFGRMSGGTGTREQVHLVIGWHALVTSFLTPLTASFIAQMGEAQQAAQDGVEPSVNGASALLAIVGVALNFWLLANYVAAVHAFKNVWGVLGVLVGIPIALAVMAMTLMTGAALQ